MPGSRRGKPPIRVKARSPWRFGILTLLPKLSEQEPTWNVPREVVSIDESVACDDWPPARYRRAVVAVAQQARPRPAARRHRARARERSHLFPDCDVHYRQCGAVLHPVVDEPLTPRCISALDPNERLMNFDTAGCLSCKAPISKTDSYQCQIATVGYFTRSEPHRKAENSAPLMSTSARRRWV